MTQLARQPTAAERIVALRLLSLALRPATDALVDEIVLLGDALVEQAAPYAAAADLLVAIADVDAEAIAAQQERLFGGQVVVPPYEGSYETDPFRQARQLADVAGFYRAFEAAADGPAADRPDHAGAELEFLAFALARQGEAEAAGREDEATACADAVSLFVAEHAGRWLPVFFEAVADAASDPFHRAVGALGVQVVGGLVAASGVAVARVRSRAPRLPIEADELTCAAGDEAVLPGLV